MVIYARMIDVGASCCQNTREHILRFKDIISLINEGSLHVNDKYSKHLQYLHGPMNVEVGIL